MDPNEPIAPATSRREALLTLAGAIATLVSCASPDGNNAGGLEKELVQELERLSARIYSEVGIPTFLVCENSESAGKDAKAPDPDGSRAALVASLRRYVDALVKVRGKVEEDDLGRLVEVLAERDFGAMRRKGL